MKQRLDWKINLHNALLIALLGIGLIASTPSPIWAQAISGQPISVTITKIDGQYQLQRGGKPYYIHGAGGEGTMAFLAECGGNSNRLWGVDQASQERLDQAHQNGISVCLGIWLEHERLGFDYSDPQSVQAQYETVIAAVEKYKNHPAVLVWGIGNEMEGHDAGDDPDLWNHVEKIANRIKQIDPHHPVMTVIAEIGGNKIPAIHQMCPSVDIIGINSYGGAASIPERYRQAKGTKPYIVTEFGPRGTWEVPKNSIDAIEEPTSTQKAEAYRRTFLALKADQELCLGAYAFLWGNKQEATATWFGLLLPDGKKTAAVDTLTELWSGKPPKNLCPMIEEFGLIGSNSVQPGANLKASLKASDPEGQPLNVRWELMEESKNYMTSGDYQARPKSYPQSIVESNATGATIHLPDTGGLYRLYAYVDDGEGAAVANLPIRVSATEGIAMGVKVPLPLTLYDEPGGKIAYVPSGWMGNAGAISVDENCQLAPKSGKHCIECKYSQGDNWGGVVWQSPAEDWGDKPGGLDLTGATKLTFWRGANQAVRKSSSASGCWDGTKSTTTPPKGSRNSSSVKNGSSFHLTSQNGI